VHTGIGLVFSFSQSIAYPSEAIATRKAFTQMGNQRALSTSFHLPDGREVILETGKLATQADGAVMLRMGKTMILATIVSNPKAKPDQPFFPLSVDYQEKFAAAGRVPGNFFRREARLSDYEVLICRLVDRALRPLFPDGYMNETQVILTLHSADKDVMPDALAGLATSAAIAVSNIPLEALFSEVRVARIDGKFVINPDRPALETADMDFIVAATKHDITMVEGEADECQEAELIEVLKLAHEQIKIQIEAQERLAQLVGDSCLIKRVLTPGPANEDLKKAITTFIDQEVRDIARSSCAKQVRKQRFDDLSENLKAHLLETMGEEFMKENASLASAYFDKAKKHIVRDVVLQESKRLDGRKLDEVRPIWSEIDYLPAAHGSAIFNRGETQSLTSVTLGTKQDQQMIDTALQHYDDNFILHYNFPAFSTGEVKPNRGPGRREVGHANLAGRTIKRMMPKDYPYTVRIVSDILESNGSSSMATVCAASLALMDGGVPLKKPMAGIAMGAISDGGKMAILSDILGDEDALGDMDFKITGTKDGICGTQMDIKIDGMPYEMLEKALLQARAGRIHILNEMDKTITAAADDLKPHAPRVISFIIPNKFIGAVIGPGGKIIQEMQKSTGSVISIEEDKEGNGVVSIFSSDKASIDAAYARVQEIIFEPEVGAVFEGEVETLQPYGVFLKFGGSKSGLLHVSEMAHHRINNVEEEYKLGDKIKFKIVEIDGRTGKMRLSARAVMMKPDGTMPADDEYMTNDSIGGGGGGDRRGGGGGYGGGDRRGGGGRDDRRGGGGGDRRR
jgi:polyribonucleotide nucleotidyltransferase